jgi:hypothetical protein
MRKFSILTILALSAGLAGVGPSFAGGGAGGSGGMGDPSAHMRYMQEVCDAQKAGTYPRDHQACLPDDMGPPIGLNPYDHR